MLKHPFMKSIFSFTIALCAFFITLNAPFLQGQEPLSENWKIEGPIVEQITHRRKVGVFLLMKMVWFFTKEVYILPTHYNFNLTLYIQISMLNYRMEMEP